MKVLLTTFFVFASSIKVSGWQKTIFDTQLAMFKSYGMNRKIMFVVGLVEMFGAVVIWSKLSVLVPIGALALVVISIGAIACHLLFDSWKDGIPAMITFTFAAILAWTNRASLISVLEIWW
jgi:hypothetical protein